MLFNVFSCSEWLSEFLWLFCTGLSILHCLFLSNVVFPLTSPYPLDFMHSDIMGYRWDIKVFLIIMQRNTGGWKSCSWDSPFCFFRGSGSWYSIDTKPRGFIYFLPTWIFRMQASREWVRRKHNPRWCDYAACRSSVQICTERGSLYPFLYVAYYCWQPRGVSFFPLFLSKQEKRRVVGGWTGAGEMRLESECLLSRNVGVGDAGR